MPYIAEEDRTCLNGEKLKDSPQTAGELNFVISELCANFILEHGLRYQQINDVVGALEGAKAEFQRRVVNPYEEHCIYKNGDTDGYADIKCLLRQL